MSLFIETLKIDKGIIHRLDYHNQRCNHTRQSFWPCLPAINIAEYIQPPTDTLLRCRILYGEQIIKVEYFPYTIRPLNSLALIHADLLEYSYKWDHREPLNALFRQRRTADDILIVKQGFLTDTSIANVALFDGQHWITPRTPLLKGTQRQYLLDSNRIIEKNIRVDSLFDYKKISVFNAMIEFNALILPINSRTIIIS